MRIGNLPKTAGEVGKVGKVYWQFAMGRDAMPSRFFDGGWRAVEFVIFKPYPELREGGEAMPTLFRIAFAYWLPFYPL